MIVRMVIVVILVQLVEGWIMQWLLPIARMGGGY